MKILYLTPYYPYPLVSGGVLAIYKKLELLANDSQIDLISITNRDILSKDIQELEKITNSIEVCRRKQGLSYLKASLVSAIEKRSVFLELIPEKFFNSIKQKLAANEYDAVICEHTYLTQWFIEKFPAYEEKTICIVCNIEKDWYYHMALHEPYGPRKLYYSLEQRAFSLIESKLFRSKANFWFYSELELEAVKKKYSEAKTLLIPILPLDLKPADGTIKDKKVILSVSRLDSARNVAGLKYFIEQVFPLILKNEPETCLFIVGKGADDNFTRYLLNSENAGSICYYGYVESLEKFYQTATLVIVPILESIGVQTKLFEAIRERSVVVCSHQAVAGTVFETGKGVMKAHTALEFAQNCIDVLSKKIDRQTIISQIEALAKQYNSQKTAELFKEYIKRQVT